MTESKVTLSIIIVSYGTAKLTSETVASIEKNYPKEVASGAYEIFVSDNDSPDNTLEVLTDYKKTSKIKFLHIIDNKKNLGFAKGNNVAVGKAKGKYVLFLNPDTVVYPNTLTTLIAFMEAHPDAGAATCKIEIPSGGIDEASHRGFPTPWNAFCHFSGFEKLFPRSRLFAGYTRGWEDFEKVHTVPAIVGAFMFVRKEAGEAIGWWDEDYFFYGEDLDFCYMLGVKGWKIYYVPSVAILHYGGVSSGIKKQSQTITTANIERKIRMQNARFDAMRIFYQKHYVEKYPRFLTWAVMQGINYLHKKNTPKITMDNKPVS
ncbi:MAG: glycosyltransferase family 2 protein [Patescibacteria group bacterium]|nr:glycosyltransferase family 2 protein [Patescibacteria group bacterium]